MTHRESSWLPEDISALPHPRNDWTRDQARTLYELPFSDLIYYAQRIHRVWFDPNRVKRNMLLSIKTGGCPEDCGYCAQSAHHPTGLDSSKLMDVAAVLAKAAEAKAAGAARFCMGAAWRAPRDRDMDTLCAMVRGVKELGLETCLTLGMLTDEQVRRFAEAGLDNYNHNLDTSPEYYPQIVTTRTYQDRVDTLARVRQAGIWVCCGGIVGMGETREDRVGLLVALATLPEHPQSVPINALMRVEGTLLSGAQPLDGIEFARTIAVARVMMPKSFVRLAAGRQQMSEETQALCFLAGANSIFIGNKLLTTGNPELSADEDLFAKLGIQASKAGEELR